jgi:cyanate permease
MISLITPTTPIVISDEMAMQFWIAYPFVALAIAFFQLLYQHAMVSQKRQKVVPHFEIWASSLAWGPIILFGLVVAPFVLVYFLGHSINWLAEKLSFILTPTVPQTPQTPQTPENPTK